MTPADLRKLADAYDQQEHMHHVLRQAADEIERLHEQIAKLYGRDCFHCGCPPFIIGG